MLHPLGTSGRIVIVDARRADYRPLLESELISRLTLCFVPSASAALRLPPCTEDRLWMINSELPDATGFELMEMLQDRLHRVPLMLVGERYETEDELQACRLGAALYVCKPLNIEILRACAGRGAEAVRGSPGGNRTAAYFNSNPNRTTDLSQHNLTSMGEDT